MSIRFKGRVSVSVLTAAVLMGVSPASATLIQTQGPVAFTGTDSVTAQRTGSPGTTSASKSTTFATKSFSQFDTANGVLTGATVSITGSRSESESINASGGAKNARKANLTASGTNSVLTAPGISQSFGDIGGTFKCQPDGVPFACPRTAGPTLTPTAGSASTSTLSAYAGPGNVSVSVSGDLGASAQIESTPTTGGNSPYTLASVTNSITWSGTMSLQYDYLAHANPSLNSINDVNVLNIDFGTVLQGSNPAAQTFAITNLFATILSSNTVGLDLDTITGPGLGSPFSLTGGTFSNLLAGLTSSNFSVDFDTSIIGSFSDQILLSLSDFDAGVGMKNYTLTVNLNGVVEELEQPPTEPVPEPASIALLGAGLLAAGGLSRWKVRKAS